MNFVSQELIAEIQRQYEINWLGIHGVAHFLRVRDNGLRLAGLTGAKPHVVELFAFFHDSRRRNDHRDPRHGPRAAEYARSLHGTFFQLSPEELDMLTYACEYHTAGLVEADVTVQTCWDSDRLDLGRVGITPNPQRLCTPAARSPEIIGWAYGRSLGA